MADILHRIAIAAPARKVYDAITTVEGLRSWWTPDCSAEPRAGSVAVFKFAGGKVVFRMRIDTLEPEKRIAWTCLGDYDEWGDTRLTWDLKAGPDGGTVLDFAHRGWNATGGEYPQCNTTWGLLMNLLKEHAEGKPVKPLFTG